ncbi:MAG: hypothetical protein JW931_09295 [Methanomicrobiaceae archaeon]|nr:hypothetical protein [Methanomicrobiaceae archaeon]
MKLPEGRERATIYNTKYSFILHNIKKFGFTGRCCATVSEIKFITVYQDGICTMADYPPYKAKNAYEKTLDLINKKGDFMLYEYLPEEIILAENNNPEYHISFDSEVTDIKKRANPFEKVLTDLKSDDIINMKAEIHNEIEDFLIKTDMNHLIKENKIKDVLVE